MNRLKFTRLLAAGIGLGLALVGGQAAAALTVTSPIWGFEDDDIDFVGTFGDDGAWVPDTNGTLDVDDILIAPFEMPVVGGVNVPDGEELTGITGLRVDRFTDLDGDGTDNDIVFAPIDEGFNAILDLIGASGITGGSAGDGAMLAMWHQTDGEDLSIGESAVLDSDQSCNTITACLQQASNGSLFQVDGFDVNDPDPDDFWISRNAETDLNTLLTTSGTQNVSFFNAGVSLLFNGTGVDLVEGARPAGIFDPDAATGDGFVDVLISGTIKGGLELSDSLKADGAVGLSDADISKTVAVPEPMSLALLAAGLLGLGAIRRGRRRT